MLPFISTCPPSCYPPELALALEQQPSTWTPSLGSPPPPTSPAHPHPRRQPDQPSQNTLPWNTPSTGLQSLEVLSCLGETVQMLQICPNLTSAPFTIGLTPAHKPRRSPHSAYGCRLLRTRRAPQFSQFLSHCLG